METIKRKSLLYKTKVEYGDYTMNYIQGCSHGCNFPCYAMQLAKRFGKIKNYEEWIKPKLVENTLEILDKELPKLKDKIEFVHLCFTTDPFMYGYQEIEKMTLEVIKKINSYNIPVEVLTKGILSDQLVEISSNKNNIFGITLVSLNENFRLKYEPNSAPYDERIKALKKCHDNGLKTWVSIEPYPTPNITQESLIFILEKISFVDYIVFGKWNYNKLISEYSDKEHYYNEQCKIIKKFCDKNQIRLHIKKGTQN